MGLPLRDTRLSSLVQRLGRVKVAIRVRLTSGLVIKARQRFIRHLKKCAILAADVGAVSAKRLLMGHLVSVVNKLIKYILANVLFLFLTPTVGVRSPKPMFFSRVHIKGGKGGFGLCGFQDVCASTRRYGTRLTTRGEIASKLVFGLSFSPHVVNYERLPSKAIGGKVKGFVHS